MKMEERICFWKYLYKCYRIWLCLLFWDILDEFNKKKAKEREEEQKKGIIRTCYVLKNRKKYLPYFLSWQ